MKYLFTYNCMKSFLKKIRYIYIRSLKESTPSFTLYFSFRIYLEKDHMIW